MRKRSCYLQIHRKYPWYLSIAFYLSIRDLFDTKHRTSSWHLGSTDTYNIVWTTIWVPFYTCGGLEKKKDYCHWNKHGVRKYLQNVRKYRFWVKWCIFTGKLYTVNQNVVRWIHMYTYWWQTVKWLYENHLTAAGAWKKYCHWNKDWIGKYLQNGRKY